MKYSEKNLTFAPKAVIIYSVEFKKVRIGLTE